MNPLITALRPITTRVRTDVTAIKRNGQSVWTREPLTDARLVKHLNGGPARGCCPIKAGESVTLVGLYDLDSHKGEVPWDAMVAVAHNLIDALELLGMCPVAFRSSGGSGIHVYLIWDAPQDAYSVRAFMAEVLESLGYASGTGGVAEREIEIFPKQDSVPVDGYGNQFILPLAGESEPLDTMFDLAPMGKDYAHQVQWYGSAPVPPRDRPTVVASVREVDLATLAQALDYIDPDVSHDEWARVLMGIHHTSSGGDEGLNLADAWSARGAKYKGRREVEMKWGSFGRRQDGPLVTVNSVLDLARKGGWVEDFSDDFEIIPVSRDEPQIKPMSAFSRDRQGRIEATVNNVTMALRRADLCGMQIRYDEFRDEIMWTRDGDDQWAAVTDADYTRLRITLERCKFKPIGRELVRDAVLLVAEDNPFDSAQTWVNQIIWDGVPRCVGFLQKYFDAPDSDYVRAVSTYLWSALAGRVLAPGCKADMVPILVGDQGVGKSTGVAAMVPSTEFFTEVSFHEKEDDLARRMRGRLLGEIGELRGLHTKELESIKAFITRTHESWVPKYREFAVNFPRRIVFVGTTNKDEFLADETGNRRWLPVRVGMADVEGIRRDRLQLWAEAKILFTTHGVEYRDAEQLANSTHDEHTIRDSWEEAVAQWLDEPHALTGEIPRAREFLRVGDVLTNALGFDVKHIKRGEEMRVGAVLRELGYSRKKIRVGGDTRWVFVPSCTHQGAVGRNSQPPF